MAFLSLTTLWIVLVLDRIKLSTSKNFRRVHMDMAGLSLLFHGLHTIISL
jgi:hypothetical protein